MSSATTLIAVNQTAASQPGQTQTQTQTPSPSSAPPTQALNGSSTGHVNVTSALLAKVHKARDRIWKKSLSVVVFIISIVALWATVSSAIDARKATKIAEWTSKKDYLEFCLEVRNQLGAMKVNVANTY